MKSKETENQIVLLSISITADLSRGISASIVKHLAKKTSKNYIAAGPNSMDLPKGFWRLRERVPIDSLMKVSEPDFLSADESCRVRREIWCLEMDKNAAIDRLKGEIEMVLQKQKQDAAALYDLWINRKQNQSSK